MREEDFTLRNGRTVHLRPGRMDDAELTMRNGNRIGGEEVYIMIEGVPNLQEELRWLSAFDGDRNVLFVALADDEVIGAADCHAGTFAKDRHGGGIGIAIQDGWREAGLGRRMMERVLEWMSVRGFAKAELAVFGRIIARDASTSPSDSSKRESAAVTSASAASTSTRFSWASGSDPSPRPGHRESSLSDRPVLPRGEFCYGPACEAFHDEKKINSKIETEGDIRDEGFAKVAHRHAVSGD